VKLITDGIDAIVNVLEGERLIDMLTALAVVTVKAIHEFSDSDTEHLFLRDMTNRMEYCLDYQTLPCI
jgi:hypothetical protein